jgi:drug/metabolite transporter (DMT)-like permease
VLTVVLALGASVCWGSGDFLSGERARRVPLLLVLLITQVTGLLIVGTAVLVHAKGPPEGDFWLPVVLGSIAAVVGLGALYRGLAVGAMSVVAPISATAAIIPVVVGLATGDRPSAVQGVGIVIALVGVGMAAREPAAQREGRVTAAGVGLALLAAGGLGCSLVALKAASDADPEWAALAFRLVMIGLVLVAVAATRPSMARGRRGDLPALCLAGLLDGGATLLFATAFSRGLLSVVSVLGGLYPVVTVILAQTVLHERLARWQRLGVVAALGGVAMIAAG